MPRRVVIAGASGLIGSALADSLRADGIRVQSLVRREARTPDEISWDPGGARLDPAALEGVEAVVGLNGASIGRIPWTRSYKRTLFESRLGPTRTIAAALRELGSDAPAFLSSSAVGFYGSVPGATLDETSHAGDAFLSGLCLQWEAAALTAADTTRVALLRTAPVVHREGVLKPLILLTKLGVSGPIGRGTQSWPWISLDDEIRGIRHVLDSEIVGPVNLTGPTRATANDLGFALAQRMNRPFALRAPIWAVRTALGRDMADSVLTTDAHVVPTVLLESGFTFSQPTVEEAVAAAVPKG